MCRSLASLLMPLLASMLRAVAVVIVLTSAWQLDAGRTMASMVKSTVRSEAHSCSEAIDAVLAERALVPQRKGSEPRTQLATAARHSMGRTRHQ